jgi:hypothetical protein
MYDAGRLKTAVFTSELRGDLGFSPPLLCIADELARLAAQEDCRLRIVFVLSDPVYYGQELSSRGHTVLPTPPIKRSIDIHSLGKSYANLLAAIGFAHERDLALLVEAWDRVLALLSANLIIADSSPLACVAARGRIPIVAVGSSFNMPPADLPVFPAMMTGGLAEANQSLILDTVNRVLQDRGVSRIQHLPELFAGDRRAVFGVPQLDPYFTRRAERLLRPCVNIEGPLAPREAPSIFFALPSTFANLTGVVRTLDRTRASMSCYVPGPETVGVSLLKGIGARVLEARPILKDVLSEAAVVLAASPDLALSGYLAGRPQVILRSDLETSVMASELENRHTAIALEIADIGNLTDAVRALLNDSSYVQSAQEEARRIQVATSDNPAATTARECLELIRSPGSGGFPGYRPGNP